MKYTKEEFNDLIIAFLKCLKGFDKSISVKLADKVPNDKVRDLMLDLIEIYYDCEEDEK